MIGKSLHRLAFAAIAVLGVHASAAAVVNVDITVTHPVGTITTYTFANFSGSTMPAGTPISMAQGFRYGDVPAAQHVVIRDAGTHTVLAHQQWDEISTWRENGGDGSWRHAVWTILMPNDLANGASYAVEFVNAAGAYSQSPVLPLGALCSGVNSHDLKIHLSDIRNQDDTPRGTGDATFRLCDHVTLTGGRDDPRQLNGGSVSTGYKIRGNFVYTDGSQDPLLYAECNDDLFVDPATGNSLKDVRWDCHIHNSWMNVKAGAAGNAGNPGPVGFANDPQAVSYQAEMLDGTTSILNWGALDATLSNPVQMSGCGDSFEGTICLNVPSSIGANTWYYGQTVRVSNCTGTCAGGLTVGGLYWVYNSDSIGTNGASTTHVVLTSAPPGQAGGIGALTNSQGTGSTTLSTRMWHPHWESWLMRDSSGDVNWSLAGGTTRATRRVYPNFTTAEKTYWEQTGLVPPLVLTQKPSLGVTWNRGDDLNYHPFGLLNVIGGSGTGPRPDIGIITEYAAQAFILGDQASWQKAQLFGLGAEWHGYSTMLNEATGRIPVLNNGPPTGPGGNGVGGSYPQLGGPFNQVGISINRVGNSSGVATPLQNVPNALYDWATGTFPGGGTFVAWIPSFGSLNYLMWGDRAYLDILQFDGNRDYLQQTPGPGPSYRDDIQAGNHYWGLTIGNCCQSRGDAWSIRDRILPAALGGDGNVERAYFNDFFVEMANYYPQYVAWRSGLSSANWSTAIIPPDNIGGSVAVDTFITDYVFLATWNMRMYLHAPLADMWLPGFARYYDAALGEDVPGHLSAYWGVSYSSSPAVHDGDHQVSTNVAHVGQYMNGTDASDWGDFSPYTDINIGGQMHQEGTPLPLTVGDTVKNISNAFVVGHGGIDQLPGNQWFTVTGPIDNVNGTYYILCPAGHPVDAYCPQPGTGPFVGFSRGGVAIAAPEYEDSFAYRPQYDGGGVGFSDYNYCGYAGEALHGLKILGYNLTNALNHYATRAGGDSASGNCYNSTTAPSQWWDVNVVVP